MFPLTGVWQAISLPHVFRYRIGMMTSIRMVNLRAGLLLGLLAFALPLALPASERETGEWVLRLGGRLMIDGNRAALRNLSDLPNGDFRITGVDLTGTLVDPNDMERIGALTSLRELYLPGPSWNPASGSRLDANDQLKYLSGLKNL